MGQTPLLPNVCTGVWHGLERRASAWRVLAVLTGLLAACLGEPTAAHYDVPAVGELGGPLPLLTVGQYNQFQRGAALFDRVYTPEMGLGPMYNGASCAECHGDPVRGAGGVKIGLRATAFYGGVCDDLSAVGGPVIQERESIPTEATGVGYRTTPPLWGAGMLDAVPDSELLALADPEDRDHDGVSGRPNWTPEGGQHVGRFGRKAGDPTLWGFVAQAYNMEMGITNHLSPLEQYVGGEPIPPEADPTPDFEVSQAEMSDADGFVRMLAPPAFAGSEELRTEGSAIFAQVGCAACHVPQLRARGHYVQSISHQVFSPYTDLLLHDMGPALADICMGEALPEEFRTEPLWGLRFRSQFLHDGRATTIAAAVELHAGEATGARERYLALSEQERATLLSFLGKL